MDNENQADFMQKQEEKGKKWLSITIGINVLAVFIVFALSMRNGMLPNFFGTALWLAACIFIYFGSGRAKKYFIGATIINTLYIVNGIADEHSGFILVAMAGTIIANGFMVILLLFSSSVNEFLYKQKND